jgi:alpha-mannosidase
MAPTISNHLISFEQVIVADQKNIVIETIKKAEREEGIIVRLYECFGRQTRVKVSVAFGYKETFECDMLENAMSKTDLQDLNFTPFEVKTILLTLNAEARKL